MNQDRLRFYVASAAQDFRRARNKANLQEIMARLTGKPISLLPYEEVRKKLKARGRKAPKLREIPLDAIIGSVGRYNDFTRTFLPRKDSDKDRWARVKAAMVDLTGVPPIEVYQIGEVYFVLDGNHRVSIARELGATHIQAYVTEVHTDVPLTPDVEPDDLIVKAEYADFLERTNLADLRPQADLSMSVPGKYHILEEHISAHRYFMGLEQKQEIPYEEALVHWYDTIYLPVVRVIREQGILRDFPDRTETDLYLWLSEHRAELQEELGWEVETEVAVEDLAAQFSRKPQRVIARVGEKIRDAMASSGLVSGPPPGTWRKSHLTPRREDHLFDDILVAIGSDEDWPALEQALVLAQFEDARLYGLHVVSSKAGRFSRRAKAVQAEFDRRCEEVGVMGNLVIEVGEVARSICERSRWVDLVVLNLKHPPAPRPLAKLGSGLSTIIRQCPRPILTVPQGSSPMKRVLLAYDGSPKAEEALFVATYLSRKREAFLVVLHVIENGRASTEPLTRAQDYLQAHGVEATFVKKRDRVADMVISTVRNRKCDLVIMGGYGFSPVLEIVLGSAVDEVLRTSCVPALICH